MLSYLFNDVDDNGAAERHDVSHPVQLYNFCSLQGITMMTHSVDPQPRSYCCHTHLFFLVGISSVLWCCMLYIGIRTFSGLNISFQNVISPLRVVLYKWNRQFVNELNRLYAGYTWGNSYIVSVCHMSFGSLLIILCLWFSKLNTDRFKTHTYLSTGTIAVSV